ncbi:MAG TPA: PsbP-related protein [Candidatus Paceibacterota bacterium]|nr:PsbP-related protein [Candidatus Paceibacterota bacterium]
MNTKTVIAIVVALVVIIGGFFLLNSRAPLAVPTEVVETGTDEILTYSNEEFGLSFEYPINLYLHERTDAGTPERSQLSLFLVEDTEENRDVLEGRNTEPREGPIGITVDVYQNPEELPATEWVQTDTNWTVANSSAEQIRVAEHDAVTFTWSGLYEGKTVVVTEGDKAYVLSTTWMSPEDTTISDFEAILNSLEI